MKAMADETVGVTRAHEILGERGNGVGTVTADVVVADISILNPNVFYELGVRHGVAERGVFMIHAGWSRRPFDVAPDRTFGYDGSLFIPCTERDEDRRGRIDAEAARLGDKL